MSAPQRLLCTLSQALPPPSSISTFKSRTFLFLPFAHPYWTLSPSLMPRNQRSGGGHGERRWKEKQITEAQVSAIGDEAAVAAETVTNKLAGVHIGEHSGQTSAHHENKGSTAIWKPKSYGTVSGATATEVENTPVGKVTVDGSGVGAVVASTQSSSSGSAGLSKLFRGNLLENFTVDNSTYASARIRATFYPKFENEKSDQETRTRIIEMVSKGFATLEVSLKHSGSLFMYAGHEGGAYAKNSFGNMYAHERLRPLCSPFLFSLHLMFVFPFVVMDGDQQMIYCCWCICSWTDVS